MKTIHVVAAIIFRTISTNENSNLSTVRQVLATQRGYGAFKGNWEFPGGKIENGESPKEALAREIQEELAAEICVKNLIHTIEYDYPDFHLSMECFECSLAQNQEITLIEHQNAKWLNRENLFSVNWLPADKDILNLISEML